MNSTRFYFLCLGYVLVILVLECRHVGSKSNSKGGSNEDCAKVLNKQHVQKIYMKMGLCRHNLSVVCLVKPMHQCYKNAANFRAIAYVKGELGQCLIEANVTKKRTLQFYIETKLIKNPNQEGSRSMGGGEKERHQKGKCMLKYYCYKGTLIDVRMDCGSTFISQGVTSNLTKQRRIWKAPPNFKDFIFFTADINVTKHMREVDIASVRIFGSGTKEDDIDPEVRKELAESLSSKPGPKKSGEAPKGSKITSKPKPGG